VIAIFIIGVIPFLLGLIFELVVVSPLRVGMDQSPLYFPAQVGESFSLLINSTFLSVFHFLFHLEPPYILGLGSWCSAHKNHLCYGHDGPGMVAEKSFGPGQKSKTL
jgi:hypothetical protein